MTMLCDYCGSGDGVSYSAILQAHVCTDCRRYYEGRAQKKAG